MGALDNGSGPTKTELSENTPEAIDPAASGLKTAGLRSMIFNRREQSENSPPRFQTALRPPERTIMVRFTPGPSSFACL